MHIKFSIVSTINYVLRILTCILKKTIDSIRAIYEFIKSHNRKELSFMVKIDFNPL